MYTVTITEGPARRLFAVPHKGAYNAIGAAFDALGTIVAARNLWPHAQGMVAVYYDDPNSVPEADLTSHAGLVVDAAAVLPDGLQEMRLPGGKMAVLRFKGPYSGLKAAYDYLYGVWLPGSGEEAADSPPFEDYINNPMDTAPADLLTDICVPIK